jgi:hypothetical protein
VHDFVRAAARNNAEWCDLFCRTHGVEGRFAEDRWYSPVRTPPYYPDAVTLRTEPTAEQVLAGVDTGAGCSVKDSFDVLDLEPHGFRPLFSGEWLLAEPSPGCRLWTRVVDAEALRGWSAAWGDERFFRPALLDLDAVAVLAAYDGDRIAAGAVANLSESVVGLSNVFDTTGDLERAWRDGAAAAAAIWPGLPAVAYDAGASLEAARAAGFSSIGRLAVWISES